MGSMMIKENDQVFPQYLIYKNQEDKILVVVNIPFYNLCKKKYFLYNYFKNFKISISYINLFLYIYIYIFFLQWKANKKIVSMRIILKIKK